MKIRPIESCNMYQFLRNKRSYENNKTVDYPCDRLKYDIISYSDKITFSQKKIDKTSPTKKINDKKANLGKNRIIVISGSSGVGKDTVISAFMKNNPKYVKPVSYTTRPIRPGEQNGVDYFFISDEEFDRNITNDEFIEWSNFSGYKYGTKRDSLDSAMGNGNAILLKLDTNGAKEIKKMFPESTLIFILPPSIEQLEARLRGRKTESEKDIQKRMSVISKEIEDSKFYDYTIVNDNIENAVIQLEKILN